MTRDWFDVNTTRLMQGLVIALVVGGFFGYEYLRPYWNPNGEETHPSAQAEQGPGSKPHAAADLPPQEDAHDESSATHETSEPNASGETDHEASKAEHRRIVKLTKAQRKPLDLAVREAKAGSAHSTITRPATVRFNWDRLHRVGPRVSAKLETVLVDRGEQVDTGQPIALMSSTTIGTTRAKFLTAQARLDTARARYNREKTLREQNISSEEAFLEAKAQYKEAQATLRATRETLRLYGIDEERYTGIQKDDSKPLSYFYLRSPLSGVLQTRDVRPGETVDSSATPFHVVNTRTVWVMIDAYEQDIPYLKPGQSMRLTVRSLPNTTFSGTVDWVSQQLDEATRTLPVRAVVQNKQGQLKSGMYARATIETGSPKTNALVPAGAVQTIHGQSMVFVPGDAKGTFRAVVVRTGPENQGQVELRSGLRPGQPLVTSGAFDLKSILTSTSRSASHGH